MFGSTRSGANAYAKVGLETGVVAASPHKLIVMLFEGAITAVNAALAHMSAGELEQKGKAVSKAMLIVDERHARQPGQGKRRRDRRQPRRAVRLHRPAPVPGPT